MSWNYTYTPTIWPSFLTALLMLALTFYSARRRLIPGVLPFMIGTLFCAAWAAGSVMEHAAIGLPAKIFWIKFQATWQLPAVTTMTCFVLEYAWPGRWLTRRNLSLLSIAPLLVLGLIISDDLHHLMWRGFRIDGSIIPQLGPGSWMAISYSFGLVILNLIVFAWLFRHSPQHRWPVVIMVVGHIGVRAMYLLEKTGLIRSDLPMDVLGLAFIDLMYAIVLYGYSLFDPIPLARQTAIEQLYDGMLVLDPHGRVASLNPAAEWILGAPLKHVQGKPIGELLPKLSELNSPLPGAAALSMPIEMNVGPGDETRCYELSFSPLDDFRGLPVGQLLLLHDVTAKKQAQALLVDQQRALATLKERERLARELHDELSQELSYINVQAQAVDDLLVAGKVEQASVQLRLLAQIARETQVDVRGQISKLSLDNHEQGGFVSELRRFLGEFERIHGIPVELILSGDPSEVSLEPTAEVQLLRIAQEALTNIRKHACAKRICIYLERNLQCFTLAIQDDGAGFIPNEHAAGRRTFGLHIMAERAAEIGGNLEVQSTPGQGTRVVVEVPLQSNR